MTNITADTVKKLKAKAKAKAKAAAKPPRPDRYYIAYGSNLNINQMARRCPYAQPVGAFELPDTRLVFRGVADVEWHEGRTCPVGLWKITADCERRLDIYEGFDERQPNMGLYAKEYLRVRVGKKTVQALIYVMNRGRYAMPSDSYFETIRIGYQDFGLPVKALYASRKETFRLMDHRATPRYSWRPSDVA